MSGSLYYDSYGWPYFGDEGAGQASGQLKDVPVYTRELAAKLKNGDAAVAAAQNAATQAGNSATAAASSAATAQAATTLLHGRYVCNTGGATVAGGAWTKQPLDVVADASTTSVGTLNVAARTVTLTQAGLYALSANVSTTSGAFALRIMNGATDLGQGPVGAGVSVTQSLTIVRRLPLGAVLSVEIYSATATSTRAENANEPSHFSITRLGA